MTQIQAIQAELIAAFEALTLPNGLGAPTGYKHEPDGGFASADLPAVVVNRGIMSSTTHLAAGRKIITREYISDLYTYTTEESDVVKATERNNTADCVDTVLAAFPLYDLSTGGVFTHQITADTDDVELYARDTTQNYIGVRFRHEVVYLQT